MNYQDMIRHGVVSTTNHGGRTATVIFSDYGGQPSGELSVLKNSSWFPEVGDRVLCLLLPNGHGDGFIVGAI